MKWLLVPAIAILALLPLGCKKEDDESPLPHQETTADYFPVNKGNKWVWVGGVLPDRGDTIRWEVRDRVVLDNGQSTWQVHQERFWEDRARNLVDSTYFQIKPGLVLLFMNKLDPDADTVLNYPLTTGKSWTVAHVTTKNVMRKSRVMGKEDVETPYGSFEDALRIDTEDRTVAKDSVVMKTSDWYVEDIGRVYSRVEVKNQVWEMRLLTMERH